MNDETRPGPGSARGDGILHRPPASWTAADQAELDVLVWELVTRIPEHKAKCALCAREAAEGWPCPRVTAAIEAVTDWLTGRRLLSKAEWLRSRTEAAA